MMAIVALYDEDYCISSIEAGKYGLLSEHAMMKVLHPNGAERPIEGDGNIRR